MGEEVLDTVTVILAEADDFGVGLDEVVDVNGAKVRKIVVLGESRDIEAGGNSLVLHRLEPGSNSPHDARHNSWGFLVKDSCGFRPATAGDFAHDIPGIFRGLKQVIPKQAAITG